MSEDQKPLLRVVNPDATPEEDAAGAPAPAPPRSQWASPHRQVRRTLPHGAGAWRASGLPH